MKAKPLIITALLFFICINTTYFWEHQLESWHMLFTVILLIVFLILTVGWLSQLRLLIRSKFKDRPRLYSFIILTATLVLTALFPAGIINYEKLEGPNWIVAQREGAAHCMTTIKLKTNKNFTEEVICFGISRKRGVYTIRNDTIFLLYKEEDDNNYQYGLIRRDTSGIANNRDALFLTNKGEDKPEASLIITNWNN